MAKDQKISRAIHAKAVPVGDGTYLAEWACPGYAPEYVLQDGFVRMFQSAEAARAFALGLAVETFNARLITNSKPERYEKMTPADLSGSLRSIGITPTFLAYLVGTRQSRVDAWLTGAEDIPHTVRLLVQLMSADYDLVDTVEGMTWGVTTDRKPRREEQTA